VREGSLQLVCKDTVFFERVQELMAIKFSEQSIKELSNPEYFQFVLPGYFVLLTNARLLSDAWVKTSPV